MNNYKFLIPLVKFWCWFCVCFFITLCIAALISVFLIATVKVTDNTIQETLPCFEKYNMICLEKQDPCIIVKDNEFVIIDSNSNFISYYKERTTE